MPINPPARGEAAPTVEAPVWVAVAVAVAASAVGAVARRGLAQASAAAARCHPVQYP